MTRISFSLSVARMAARQETSTLGHGSQRVIIEGIAAFCAAANTLAYNVKITAKCPLKTNVKQAPKSFCT